MDILTLTVVPGGGGRFCLHFTDGKTEERRIHVAGPMSATWIGTQAYVTVEGAMWRLVSELACLHFKCVDEEQRPGQSNLVNALGVGA